MPPAVPNPTRNADASPHGTHPARYRHSRPAGLSGKRRRAEKWGLDASQLANQFVTTRDFVTSNIIGATTMEQLKLAVTSVDLEMSDELLGEIEAVHMRAPNVCP